MTTGKSQIAIETNGRRMFIVSENAEKLSNNPDAKPVFISQQRMAKNLLSLGYLPRRVLACQDANGQPYITFEFDNAEIDRDLNRMALGDNEIMVKLTNVVLADNVWHLALERARSVIAQNGA